MKLFTKLLVKDIMVTDVLSLPLDMPLLDIARLLQTNRIHGAPVVNAERKVIGIVTESDFFLREDVYLHLPSLMDIARVTTNEASLSAADEAAVREIAGTQASDVMTSPCTTIRAETPAGEAINVFAKTHYKTIPVVDAADRLIGIVTLADILNVIKSGTL